MRFLLKSIVETFLATKIWSCRHGFCLYVCSKWMTATRYITGDNYISQDVRVYWNLWKVFFYFFIFMGLLRRYYFLLKVKGRGIFFCKKETKRRYPVPWELLWEEGTERQLSLLEISLSRKKCALHTHVVNVLKDAFLSLSSFQKKVASFTFLCDMS